MWHIYAHMYSRWKHDVKNWVDIFPNIWKHEYKDGIIWSKDEQF